MEVTGYKLGGNSFPIIIQDDTKKYLVKLKAGMSGEYSLFNEWFGNILGSELGINTRHPAWIHLDESLQYDNIYIEVRDLIEKSSGINISFDYIENAHPLSKANIEMLNKKDYIEVYLLDVLMLNIDRSTSNLNILKDANGNLIISDYESSLLFNKILNNSNITEDGRILQCLKSNPFYQQVGSEELESFLSKINNINFELLITDLPETILSIHKQKELITEFEKQKLSLWNLKDTLDKIDTIVLETDEIKNARIKRNREKLENLVNSSLKSQ